MKTEAVCVLLGVVSIISWIGATPIADKEWKETNDHLDRDKRDAYAASIKQSMNHFVVDNAASESNNESFERSKQHHFIEGAEIVQNGNRYEPQDGIVRGAVIVQTGNEYLANSNGGTIQGAVIEQTRNLYEANSHNGQDHKQKSVATDSNQQAAEKLTSKDDIENSKLGKIEEVKSSTLEKPSTTITTNPSKTEVNKSNDAQPETQLPQSENVDDSHGQNEDHGYVPSQYGFPPLHLDSFNYFPSNYNNYGQKFRPSQTRQDTAFLPPQSGSQPPQPENSNNNDQKQGVGQPQILQGTEYVPFQYVFPSLQLDEFNYLNNEYIHYGQGYGRPQAPQAFPGGGLTAAQLYFLNQGFTIPDRRGNQQITAQSGIGNHQFTSQLGSGNQQIAIQQGLGNDQATQENGSDNQQSTIQQGFSNQQSIVQKGFLNQPSSVPSAQLINQRVTPDGYLVQQMVTSNGYPFQQLSLSSVYPN